MGPTPAIILNGEPADPAVLARLKEALSTPDIVAEKGGYLFKSRAAGEVFHLGILPSFQHGQRSYHYNIVIEPSEFNLIGSVNANRTLTAVFQQARASVGQPLPEADRTEYRRQYAELGRFLLHCGLPASFPLDAISSGILQEAGLVDEAPVTSIGQLTSLGGQS
jgi:hypothetical protein